MRTAASGFFLGYLTVLIVLTPALLWALDVAPSYPRALTLTLERAGVIGASQRYAREAGEFRDRLMWQLSRFVADKISAHSSAEPGSS